MEKKNAGVKGAKSPNPMAEAPVAPKGSTGTASTEGTASASDDSSKEKADEIAEATKAYNILISDLAAVPNRFAVAVKDVGIKTFVESDAFARVRKGLDALANDLAALDKTDPRNCLPFKVRAIKNPESVEDWVKRYRSEGRNYDKDMLNDKGEPNFKKDSVWFHEGQHYLTYRVLYESGEEGISYDDLKSEVEKFCKSKNVEFDEKQVRTMITGMCLGSPDWAVPGSGTLKGVADGKDGKLYIEYDAEFAKQWHNYFAPATVPSLPTKKASK